MVQRIATICFCVVLLGKAAAHSATHAKPHLFIMLIDDWGYANVGFHRTDSPTKEVITPNMDAIATKGIILDRAYAYRFCSPTRSSLNSGRLPVHVNVLNVQPVVHNPRDPVSGFAGIPRNMTGFGTVMARGGYDTHQIGKWDAGMATPDHTPLGRGYKTSFGYFHHDNDYWDETIDGCGNRSVTDLWVAEMAAEKPAYGMNGSTYDHSHVPHVLAVNGSVADYEDYKFGQRAVSIIEQWQPGDNPIFVNYDSHNCHEPLQVPQSYFDKFSFIKDDYESHRQVYAAMVNFVDDTVGNITSALKAKGMWADTLFVGWSDNGGPSWVGSYTANNYPLRGSKADNFEGGVRVNGYVGGGYLATVAPHMIGTHLTGLVHIADLYATFAGIAGVDPTDHRAAAAGLPPIDSIDMMPYWTGQVAESPRTTVYHDPWALTVGDLKILTGKIPNACWTGPAFPNASTSTKGCEAVLDCGDFGCLFNTSADPTEHVDLAHDPSMAATMEHMRQLLATANATFFNPDRGSVSKLACEAALGKYGGFWGPFLP